MAKINDPDWAWRARGNTHRKSKAKKGKKNRPKSPKTQKSLIVRPNGDGCLGFYGEKDYYPGLLTEWTDNALSSLQKATISYAITHDTVDIESVMCDYTYLTVDLVSPLSAEGIGKIDIELTYYYEWLSTKIRLYIADFEGVSDWELIASKEHTDPEEDEGTKELSGYVAVDIANYISSDKIRILVVSSAVGYTLKVDKIVALFTRT